MRLPVPLSLCLTHLERLLRELLDVLLLRGRHFHVEVIDQRLARLGQGFLSRTQRCGFLGLLLCLLTRSLALALGGELRELQCAGVEAVSGNDGEG